MPGNRPTKKTQTEAFKKKIAKRKSDALFDKMQSKKRKARERKEFLKGTKKA